MKNTTIRRMLIDEAYLQNRIKSYIEKNLLYNSTSHHEIAGHMKKARHNLEFLNEIRELFSDWIVVVSYYAVYHASLALILSKGFFSKNHDATL